MAADWHENRNYKKSLLIEIGQQVVSDEQSRLMTFVVKINFLISIFGQYFVFCS
jgi:hypothetical protein